MRNELVAAAGVVLAAGAGFVGGTLSGAVGDPPTDGRVDELARRLARLESVRSQEPAPDGDAPRDGRPAGGGEPSAPSAAVDDVRGTSEVPAARHDPGLAALEARIVSNENRTAGLMLWAGGMAPAPRDPDAELRRFEELASPALLEEIRKLVRTQWKGPQEQEVGIERAVLACDAFLSRSADPAQRAEALTAKGTLLRTAGDFDASATALREAQGLVAADSKEGIDAATQLGFTAVFRKDFAAAADHFLGVSRLPSVSDEVRARYRKMAGSYLALVDVPRGRAELRGVVEEFGSSEDKYVRAEVDQARKELEKLEHAGGR